MPVVASGDVFAGCWSGAGETYESIKIVRQAVDMLPEGPINLGNKIPKGTGNCEFIGCREAPRGHWCTSCHRRRPTNHRLSIHVPTFKNAPTVETMLRATPWLTGLIVASIDPCFSCMDC